MGRVHIAAWGSGFATPLSAFAWSLYASITH